jgi:outer membrane protein assembly factor BamB
LSDDDRVTVVTFRRELVTFAVPTGRVVHRFRIGDRVLLNFALQNLPVDRYALISESHLRVYDGEGQVLWEDQNRGERGLIPPAFGALAVGADRLYVGGSDGRVECREQKTGQVMWQVPLESSYIEQLYVTGTKPERVLVVGQGGLLHGLRDGKVDWRLNVSRGIERDGGLAYRLTPAGLAVAQPWHGRIVLIDPERGRIKDLAPHAANWSATNRHLIVWSGGRVQAYPLPADAPVKEIGGSTAPYSPAREPNFCTVALRGVES